MVEVQKDPNIPYKPEPENEGAARKARLSNLSCKICPHAVRALEGWAHMNKQRNISL